MAFASTEFDWQIPTDFGQGYDTTGEDSFASLKSYFEGQQQQRQQQQHMRSADEDGTTEDTSGYGMPLPGGNGSGSSPDSSDERPDGLISPQDDLNSSISNNNNSKRKKGPAALPAGDDALKDRKSGEPNAMVLHTHGTDSENGNMSKRESKKKGGAVAGTSEKRKEQNRNAQRAFRERREKYARELEDKLSALHEVADARQAENESLKELVAKLQAENAQLGTTGSATEPIPALANSAFTFNMPKGTPSSSGTPDSAKTNESAASSATTRSQSHPASEGNSKAPDLSSLFSLPSHGSNNSPEATQSGSSSLAGSNLAADPMLSAAFSPDFLSWSTTSPQYITGLTPGSNRDQPTPSPSNGQKHDLYSGNSAPQGPLSPMSSLSAFGSFPSSTGQDLFTPSGEHLNPYASFEDLFQANPNPAAPPSSNANSTSLDKPSPASDLFASYRDSPASDMLHANKTSTSNSVISPPPALTGEAEEPLATQPQDARATSEPKQDSSSSCASTRSASLFDQRYTPPSGSSYASSPQSVHDADKTSDGNPKSNGGRRSLSSDHTDNLKDRFQALRGSEAFDVDSLCTDMKKKATCQDHMKQALDNAVQQDLDAWAVMNTLHRGAQDAYRR